MKETKIPVAVCFPYTEKESKTKGKGVNCVKCNLDVWLSDSTVSRMKETFTEIDFEKIPPMIICFKCAAMAMQELEDSETKVEVMPPTAAQLQELKEIIIKEHTNTN